MALYSAGLCSEVFRFVFCEVNYLENSSYLLGILPDFGWYLASPRQERHSPQHGLQGRMKNKDSFCKSSLPKVDMLHHAGLQLSSV